MPLLATDFLPTLPFRNGHFNTIYRSVFTKVTHQYKRKRVPTWDGDFIDLDFSTIGSNTAALLIHGLEGSSESTYMITTTQALNNIGIDVIAMNLRGCSGEDNLLLGTYHSGKTEDVDFIIDHILTNYSYNNIIIIGFSLGGNLTLKYMGEYADTLDASVKGAIAVSVPIDIASSEREMEKLKNKLYLEQFLKTMRLKVLEKSHKFPDFNLDKDKLFKASKFKHLEHLYTVPVFGFDSPEDYWEKASSKKFLAHIQRPTLLVNAKDDSFLGEACFPVETAKNSRNFFLEITNYGGHVGFVKSFNSTENTWLEERICRFITEKIAL